MKPIHVVRRLDRLAGTLYLEAGRIEKLQAELDGHADLFGLMYTDDLPDKYLSSQNLTKAMQALRAQVQEMESAYQKLVLCAAEVEESKSLVEELIESRRARR